MKIPFMNKNNTKAHPVAKASILFLILIPVIACEKTNELPKYTPPADHTISKDGFLHKNGLDQPLSNCVSCHGSDLKGGTTAVSCYECHDKEW
jgi:hypothetical protein